MPGMTGVEAAREILQMDLGPDDWLPEIVFITAYDQYAVQAFEHGAVDYVLKPAETERLARTAERLQQRLHARHQVPADPSAGGSGALQPLLSQLAAQMAGRAPQYLEFVQAASGSTVHVIPVKDVLFFMSDEKYTRVQTATVEALIRKPIKELIDELDPRQFWQIHRSAIVQLAAVQSIARDDRGRQIVSVRGHPQKLEVSRSFSGLFKGM
jgi:DNA-binding LytR/AlgR family response regulator